MLFAFLRWHQNTKELPQFSNFPVSQLLESGFIGIANIILRKSRNIHKKYILPFLITLSVKYSPVDHLHKLSKLKKYTLILGHKYSRKKNWSNSNCLNSCRNKCVTLENSFHWLAYYF